jgi:hypothetical protein
MSVDHPYIDTEVSLTCEVYVNDVRYRVNGLEAGWKNQGCRVNGLDVVWKKTDSDKSRNRLAKRSRIECYSEKSKKRYKFLLRNTQNVWTHEMEVGYPADYPRDGRKVKRDRKLLVETMERKYSGIKWTWRLGFQQERGEKGLGYAPHLHFLTDRFVDFKWLARTWARIVGSSDINHIKAGTHVDKIRNVGKMINYMVNYMTDDKETDVPPEFENVGRFWGVKRGILEVEIFNKILPVRLAGRSMRLFKRWYRAKLRSWGIYKWKPGDNVGFTAIDGRRLFDFLMGFK